jgi:heme exporter protein A
VAAVPLAHAPPVLRPRGPAAALAHRKRSPLSPDDAPPSAPRLERANAELLVERVGKIYAGRRALIDVSLTFRPGEITTILGPNGAGKSTLLSILATLSAPTSGGVRWGNIVLTKGCAERRFLGYVGHEPGLYLELGARRNLALFARLYGLDEPEGRAQVLVERVGLKEIGGSDDRPVRTFSRGMQQRLALARALLHEPAILLFDEPGSALDPLGVDWLAGELRREREGGRVVVLVTHDLETAAILADHVVILRRGRLVRDFRRADARGADVLRATYNEACRG